MTHARTVIGPLTTQFTAPGYCANVVVACPYSCTYGWQAQQCVSNGGYSYQAEDATSCWPPASSPTPTPTAPFGGWGFYSPGLICPSGYERACSATASGSSGWIVEYSMDAGETAVGCCPSGYVCGGANAQTCSSIAQSGGVVPVVTCSDGSSQAYSYLTIPQTNTMTGISSSASRVGTYDLSTFGVYAPMIEIRWQSSDITTTSPTHTGAKSTSSNTSTSSPGSGGLSTGAKAAIGVVVPVAVIAILIGIFFFWRRKIRKLNDKSEWPAPGPSSTAGFGQGGTSQAASQSQMESRTYYKNVDGRGRYMSPPRELDASPAPKELEGSKPDLPENR